MLKGVSIIQEMVQTVLMSGHLSTDKPVSLLLIAKPESGKTTIVTGQECKSAVTVTDCTGKGIQNLIRGNQECKHIIINDMLTVTAHKETVAKYTMAMISALTEEGVFAIASPSGVEYMENVGVKGVIAALTDTLSTDKRGWWNRTGFSSRMLPFAFQNSADLVMQIQESIRNGDYEKGKGAKTGNKIILELPEKPATIRITPALAKEVQLRAEFISQQLGETGLRRHKQFRSLVRAHALLRNLRSTAINKLDIDFLDRIRPFISYKECKAL